MEVTTWSEALWCQRPPRAAQRRIPMDLLCCDHLTEWCPPGSAGVPPAQRWQGLSHLLRSGRPATAPGLCFGRALAVPAGRLAGRHIAGKLSGAQRECMRAGRPRSRVGILPLLLLLEGVSAGVPGRNPADAPGASRLVVLLGPSCHFVDHSFLFVSNKDQSRPTAWFNHCVHASFVQGLSLNPFKGKRR